MRVKALTSFVSEVGPVEAGAEVEMEDSVAAVRIAAGLVEAADDSDDEPEDEDDDEDEPVQHGKPKKKGTRKK